MGHDHRRMRSGIAKVIGVDVPGLHTASGLGMRILLASFDLAALSSFVQRCLRDARRENFPFCLLEFAKSGADDLVGVVVAAGFD